MSRHCKKSNAESTVSRRDFLRLAGAGATSLLIQSCQSQARTIPPVPKPADNISTQVAVSQARTYDRETIESQVHELIEDLGGLGEIVRPGDTVAIKTNLTGDAFWFSSIREKKYTSYGISYFSIIRGRFENNSRMIW